MYQNQDQIHLKPTLFCIKDEITIILRNPFQTL